MDIVEEATWENLKSSEAAGRLEDCVPIRVSVTKIKLGDDSEEDGEEGLQVDFNPRVCDTCMDKKKSEQEEKMRSFQSATISVFTIRGDAELPLGNEQAAGGRR